MSLRMMAISISLIPKKHEASEPIIFVLCLVAFKSGTLLLNWVLKSLCLKEAQLACLMWPLGHLGATNTSAPWAVCIGATMPLTPEDSWFLPALQVHSPGDGYWSIVVSSKNMPFISRKTAKGRLGSTKWRKISFISSRDEIGRQLGKWNKKGCPECPQGRGAGLSYFRATTERLQARIPTP